jgi:hypothetical protein
MMLPEGATVAFYGALREVIGLAAYASYGADIHSRWLSAALIDTSPDVVFDFCRCVNHRLSALHSTLSHFPSLSQRYSML